MEIVHGVIACVTLVLLLPALLFSKPVARFAWYCGVIGASCAALLITSFPADKTALFAISSCACALIFFLQSKTAAAPARPAAKITVIILLLLLTAGVIRQLVLVKTHSPAFNGTNAAAWAILFAFFAFAGLLALARGEKENG